MAHPTDPEPTLSYPSIAILLTLIFFTYRYFTKSSSTTSTSTSSSARNNGLRFTQSQVDQVSSMFPQLSQRDIMWDLQRNRGSVNATVERVLGGRGLDPAPPSFQPPLPQPQPNTSTSPSSLLSRAKKAEPDLITRYKLQDRISQSDKGKQRETSDSSSSGAAGSGSGRSPQGVWGATKTERMETLRNRREEMILEARRKMLERDAARTGQGSGMFREDA